MTNYDTVAQDLLPKHLAMGNDPSARDSRSGAKPD
jgi:hypothetical protein